MQKSEKPTLGLALSGSGDRTTFYIGFLEVLDEAGIKIDYISACSGGSFGCCFLRLRHTAGAKKSNFWHGTKRLF